MVQSERGRNLQSNITKMINKFDEGESLVLLCSPITYRDLHLTDFASTLAIKNGVPVKIPLVVNGRKLAIVRKSLLDADFMIVTQKAYTDDPEGYRKNKRV